MLLQPVTKSIYDPNSSSKLKKYQKTLIELNWIKFLQSTFPLGFNDNICQEGNISKMSQIFDFDVLSLLNVKNVKIVWLTGEKTAKFLYRSYSCFK